MWNRFSAGFGRTGRGSPKRTESVKRAIVGVLAVCGLAAAALQDQPRVPCDIQFDLAVKILTFDRNLKARVGDELVFGILYQEDFPASPRVQDRNGTGGHIHFDQDRRAGADPVGGDRPRPVRPLGGRVERGRRRHRLPGAVAGLLLRPGHRPLPGIENDDHREPARITRRAERPSGSNRRATVPHILINLKAARAEGADFNSRLLGLAKVFR